MLKQKAITQIAQLNIVSTKIIEDKRGSFSRVFCSSQLENLLSGESIKQMNISDNIEAGTVRGLHYQNKPYGEIKLVRCIKGRIFDLVVDIRKKSKTFLHCFSIELSEENGLAVVIPEGFAHGFQTLENDSKVLYLHTSEYNPNYEAGLNVLDPSLSINWPLPIKNLSDRDMSFANIERGYKGY